MAYYHPNPDDLPAHAEPEQAAQILGGGGGYQQPQPLKQHRPSQSQGRPQPQVPNPNSYGSNSSHSGRSHGHQSPPPPNPGRHQGFQSPPPQSFGGSPPNASYQGHLNQQQQNQQHHPQQYQQPPHATRPQSSRPPPTPAPAQGVDPTLLPLFKAVDKDGSGQLSEKELKSALVNGDWTSFDSHTVRMMIRMFDTDRDGTIGFNEFCGLWGFLAAWRALFDRFDADHSGNISYDEFSNALAAFGYRLSPQFVQLLFRSYDKRGANAISFDLFVQSCISLKRMTEVFKKYDDDRDGYITLSFEDFLTVLTFNR